MDEAVEIDFRAGLGCRNDRQSQFSHRAHSSGSEPEKVSHGLWGALQTLEHAAWRATGCGITAGFLCGEVSVEDKAAETIRRLSVRRARRGDDLNEHSDCEPLLIVDSSRGGISELLPLARLGAQFFCLLGIALGFCGLRLCGEFIHLGLELGHAGLGLWVRPAPL